MYVQTPYTVTVLTDVFVQILTQNKHRILSEVAACTADTDITALCISSTAVCLVRPSRIGKAYVMWYGMKAKCQLGKLSSVYPKEERKKNNNFKISVLRLKLLRRISSAWTNLIFRHVDIVNHDNMTF